jgi:hypothetical protein
MQTLDEILKKAAKELQSYVTNNPNLLDHKMVEPLVYCSRIFLYILQQIDVGREMPQGIQIPSMVEKIIEKYGSKHIRYVWDFSHMSLFQRHIADMKTSDGKKERDCLPKDDKAALSSFEMNLISFYSNLNKIILDSKQLTEQLLALTASAAKVCSIIEKVDAKFLTKLGDLENKSFYEYLKKFGTNDDGFIWLAAENFTYNGRKLHLSVEKGKAQQAFNLSAPILCKHFGALKVIDTAVLDEATLFVNSKQITISLGNFATSAPQSQKSSSSSSIPSLQEKQSTISPEKILEVIIEVETILQKNGIKPGHKPLIDAPVKGKGYFSIRMDIDEHGEYITSRIFWPGWNPLGKKDTDVELLLGKIPNLSLSEYLLECCKERSKMTSAYDIETIKIATLETLQHYIITTYGDDQFVNLAMKESDFFSEDKHLGESFRSLIKKNVANDSSSDGDSSSDEEGDKAQSSKHGITMPPCPKIVSKLLYLMELIETNIAYNVKNYNCVMIPEKFITSNDFDGDLLIAELRNFIKQMNFLTTLNKEQFQAFSTIQEVASKIIFHDFMKTNCSVSIQQMRSDNQTLQDYRTTATAHIKSIDQSPFFSKSSSEEETHFYKILLSIDFTKPETFVTANKGLISLETKLDERVKTQTSTSTIT